MTLLEAVNLCLRSTGETGVAALTSNHPKFQTILATINEVSLKAQRRGWWFNTGVRTLSPISGGPNDGKLDVSMYDLVKPVYRYQEFFPQAGFLIDARTGTAVTGIAVQAEARWVYPTTDEGWTSLPDAFSDYVGADAALTFAANYDADPLQLQKLMTQRAEAKAVVNADHIRYASVNLFNSGSAGIAIQRAWGPRYNRLYR